MAAARTGRPVEVDPDHVAEVALRLFAERGFDAVTMDDVAVAAGVSRRTLFRVFRTKDDLVWGGTAEAADRMAAELAALPDRADPYEAMRTAHVAALTFPSSLIPVTRARLRLIADHERLSAGAVTRLGAGRDLVVGELRRRLGPDASPLLLEVRTSAMAAAVFAAMTFWARQDGGDPATVVDRALAGLVRDWSADG
ncbi:TetR family transcriptional regulator [Curtobacterium sp. MCBD17_040]|uniref:TetR family transcriptional regulator n=1 Tax=Curtobacterium sp. MCBD17_040 TaxID=2175674 RepID=UPI001C647389|nr:TetR family transcriptional regulator [Curtobacterium sp. MCBD17_040]WIB62509.1 TetR family transcriptional regulator [Curtobacterium sp. MCBD17_040]